MCVLDIGSGKPKENLCTLNCTSLCLSPNNLE